MRDRAAVWVRWRNARPPRGYRAAAGAPRSPEAKRRRYHQAATVLQPYGRGVSSRGRHPNMASPRYTASLPNMGSPRRAATPPLPCRTPARRRDRCPAGGRRRPPATVQHSEQCVNTGRRPRRGGGAVVTRPVAWSGTRCGPGGTQRESGPSAAPAPPPWAAAPTTPASAGPAGADRAPADRCEGCADSHTLVICK